MCVLALSVPALPPRQPRTSASSDAGRTLRLLGPLAFPEEEVVMSFVYHWATVSLVTSGVSSTTAEIFTPLPANSACTMSMTAVASCGGGVVMPAPLYDDLFWYQ